MINKLLNLIADRLPGLIISDDGKPYLERYFIAQFLGMTFYLHRFVGSDPDRGLHDHPWRWAMTFILSGFGYVEETRYGLEQRRWFGFFSGQHFHRVHLFNGPVWTLFIHSSTRVKPWGFWRHTVSPTQEWTGRALWNQHRSSSRQWWDTAPKGAFLEGRVR